MQKRVNFSRIKEVFSAPDLLEIQLNSYKYFLQTDVPKTKRELLGLEEVFQEIFPITNADQTYKLEYLYYTLGKPKYNEWECKRRSLTYSAPLRIKLRIRSKDESKEQEVYLADVPLMTDTGTFIINGDERVVVSQLHRSPGISFESNIRPDGKKIYSARIIPTRGAWVEFEFDANDILHVVIDRRRKFLATSLLRVMGYSTDEEILQIFSGIEHVVIRKPSQVKKLIDKTIIHDIVEPESGQIIVAKESKITHAIIKSILKYKIREVSVLVENVPEITKTLDRDKAKNKEEALLDIFRKLRPGDPPTLEMAELLVQRLFFDPKRYDLGEVGRYMLNRKLNVEMPLEKRVLDKETIILAIKKLIAIKNEEIPEDDIDHLGNRRIRTVGEQLQNQIRIGLVRIERTVQERMNIYDLKSTMPHNLINSKLVATIIKDFFGRGQLSQFMDQTNPLAELTHKRRLSALGPGGLNRKRAGFEVRDVHYSHYGRMCPIETPEGPNIGLIASLTTYARINKFGFLEAPYRKVVNEKVTNKIEYLSADIEDQYVIAQANAQLDSDGSFVGNKAFCRYKNDFLQMDGDKIQYMDVSPKQVVSVAAGLIPFLEHDDANRALMGSNMQRQAVPLFDPEAPLVGTGLEGKVAKDSGTVIVAKNAGKVTEVQANRIVVGSKVYDLQKFEKSNANTCVNQRPLVKLGENIEEGQIIADGTGTKNGLLALGKNVLVAFMPWRGYNFEDAIVISEKLLKEDTFSSIHVEEFEIEARETRLGPEEITRDIPNVGEEALKNLDENGIVRIGAEVGPGDILVGKVAPKSETELTPEEKLLRAIFGEKAGDVRDASLTVPPGVEGFVKDVQIFARKEARSKTREERSKEQKQIQEVQKYFEEQIQKIRKEKARKLEKLLIGQKLAVGLLDDETGEILLPQNKTITEKDLQKIEHCDLENIKLTNNDEAEESIRKIVRVFDDEIEELAYEQEREIDNIKKGDELPAGVIKRIRVYVTTKRRLAAGDKMAGRHGNKGVVAKIVPEEDMPFLPDGTPVEIVLNPLGVPSRMNVGQILETHLGWAAKVLGLSFDTHVFDGAKENEIKEYMKKAGLPEDGKIVLCDGFTGKAFDQKVTVGYIYIMKLVHLVDDKIHARAIGPYSLVTQQPLGGKAQFGGQRFGEMEVWAFEAYGAAYTLQELLTVKSDDVIGRTKMYESIVKGDNTLTCGIPESFNVLVKELQGLCLDVKLNNYESSRKDDIEKKFKKISEEIPKPEEIKTAEKNKKEVKTKDKKGKK